ncbi:hypothetical protein AgCh_003670 [Apium graveolens]
MDSIKKMSSSVMGSGETAVETAKNKTCETAQATKNIFVKATAMERGAGMGESAMKSAQTGLDNTGKTLSPAGDQVNTAAKGAVDAVKKTFA